MRASIKQLRVVDLFQNRSGTFTFRLILAIFGIALKLFFRRIETVNADSVPKGTGVIFVMNHPNGLIDPALVFVALPRKIAFLAKSTLFKMPVLSFLLRTVEALPVYRKTDAGEDISKNVETFEMAHKRLQSGGSIALFPEGVSHNSPKMLPAKTGAARIALGAVSVRTDGEEFDLKIVPVGLFYTSKKTFRSEALLHFGDAFSVPAIDLDTEGQPPRDDVRDLTSRIENALRDVTLNAETDADLHTARIAEEIVSASADTDDLNEKLDFLRSYIAERGTGNGDDPLRHEIHSFDVKLERFGVEPLHLSVAQYPRSIVIKQAISRTWRLIVLLPFATAGAILHFPAYQLCRLFAMWYARHGADDVASTAKVLAGMLFMPATWLITCAVVWYFYGWEFGVAAIPAAALLGLIALYSIEQFEELRGWANAVSLYLFRREAFLRLYVERREMQKQIAASPVGD